MKRILNTLYTQKVHPDPQAIQKGHRNDYRKSKYPRGLTKHLCKNNNLQGKNPINK